MASNGFIIQWCGILIKRLTFVELVHFTVLGGREDGHENVGAPAEGDLPPHGIDGLRDTGRKYWTKAELLTAHSSSTGEQC